MYCNTLGSSERYLPAQYTAHWCTLALRVHRLRENPNIVITVFYTVGREMGKKTVYQSQL